MASEEAGLRDAMRGGSVGACPGDRVCAYLGSDSGRISRLYASTSRLASQLGNRWPLNREFCRPPRLRVPTAAVSGSCRPRANRADGPHPLSDHWRPTPGAWYDPTCMGINWAAPTKQTLSWTNIAWDN
jgi:hypothetical protein